VINTTNMSPEEVAAAIDFEANRADSVRDIEGERIAAEGGLVDEEHAAMIRRLFRGE
jgi:hypothetical protein